MVQTYFKNWKIAERIRVLVMEKEYQRLKPVSENTNFYPGDMTKRSSLEQLFQDLEDAKIILIHMAAIVDIQDDVSSLLWKVNVKGTLDLMDLAVKYKVSKVIYISSVHAIAKEYPSKIITETKEFFPDKVVGGYAKTKAEA